MAGLISVLDQRRKDMAAKDLAAEVEAQVAQHYARPDVEQAILEALVASAKDIDRLTPADLSAVDEFQDFVGPRNRTGRLPAVRTFDFQFTRPWRFKKYRFRAGIRAYNILGSNAGRDIQTNVTAPDYGQSYNPIERSIGIVFGSGR